MPDILTSTGPRVHDFVWQIVRGFAGDPDFTLTCRRCRRTFYVQGWTWTLGASPTLEKVLAELTVKEKEIAEHAGECNPPERSTT